MEAWLSSFNPVLQALFGGLIITALNMLGALVVLVWRRPSQAFLDSALGFAAGVITVLIGIALGAVFLLAADSWVPHLHTVMGREGRPAGRTSAVWLFILAITLHNMPEGLAVGVGFGSGNIGNAVALMLAIGIQNVPEGLAVSLSALSAGMGSTFYAMFVGLRAGLVEIPMALIGAWAVQIAAPILPYAMGFAAGAMLYVISDEIVPETHRMGHERWATIGIMLGVMAMLYLDVSLG